MEKDQIKIKSIGVYNEEECMCSNCGTYFRYSRQMYYLNNDDFVCSKKCFREYCKFYFQLKKVEEEK